MVGRKTIWLIFSIIASIVIITAVVVPIAIDLPRENDEAVATTTTMTTSNEISSTTKGW